MSVKWTQVALALLVLAVGVGVAAALVMARREPEKAERAAVAPLVRVERAAKADVPLTIYGYGEVRPTVRARIIPQVTGRVASIHANLHTGGYIRANEPLLTLDRIDFDLSLKRAEADAATARAVVKGAESRLVEARTKSADVAEDLRRTKLLSEEKAANAREVEKAEVAFNLAEASLAEAEASLVSSQAQLDAAAVAVGRAGVELERTTLTLPFDAVIVEESVDVGQHLTAGQSLGEAYGTLSVEVPVPLEDRDLKWLDSLPLGPLGASGDVPAGSLPTAGVEAEFAGRACVWDGRVVRTEGRIDSRSRMVSVVVRVEDPFAANEKRPPLMPGAFVKVGIEGKTLGGVIPLPRYALRAGDTVWVVDGGKLRIKPVQIARRERDRVLIASGIEEGAAVVVSPLEVATEGMEVRTEAEDQHAVGAKG